MQVLGYNNDVWMLDVWPRRSDRRRVGGWSTQHFPLKCESFLSLLQQIRAVCSSGDKYWHVIVKLDYVHLLRWNSSFGKNANELNMSRKSVKKTNSQLRCLIHWKSGKSNKTVVSITAPVQRFYFQIMKACSVNLNIFWCHLYKIRPVIRVSRVNIVSFAKRH